MTPDAYWRRCDAVVERGDVVSRRLAPCGHVQDKQRSDLSIPAQKNPQIMVGARFVCGECREPAVKRFWPKGVAGV